jgi:hypothetical protein
MDDFHISQFAISDEPLREAHGILTSLDSDHSSTRTHTLGQKIEVTLGTAADFDYLRSGEHSNLIKQRLRVTSQHLGLTLEPFLFCLPIPEKVLIDLHHHVPLHLLSSFRR